MVNLFNKNRRTKQNSDKIQQKHRVLGRMLRTVDELLVVMQKHRQNACALYIRREIGESCVFIKRGCTSLADETSRAERRIKNYRNVAFLYIIFEEK